VDGSEEIGRDFMRRAESFSCCMFLSSEVLNPHHEREREREFKEVTGKLMLSLPEVMGLSACGPGFLKLCFQIPSTQTPNQNKSKL